MYAQDFIRLRQSIRARLRSELLHPSAQMLARDRFIVHTPLFTSVFEEVATVLTGENLVATPYTHLDDNPPSVGLVIGAPEQASLFVWPHVDYSETLWLTIRPMAHPSRSTTQSLMYWTLSQDSLRQRLCGALERLLQMSDPRMAKVPPKP